MTSEQLQQLMKKSKARVDDNIKQARRISQNVKEIIERLNLIM